MGRTGRYLKYAIGEIALVVIGILIALQLNIWNEEKKARVESNEFIERLLNELRTNIQLADEEISFEKDQIDAAKNILDMINQHKSLQNSRILDSLVFKVLSSNTLVFNAGTLTEGLNTGKLALVKSDSLRTALYNLPEKVAALRRLEALDTHDVSSSLTLFLYQNFNFRKMDNSVSQYRGQIGATNFKSFDNLSVLDNMQFESSIDNRFFNNQLVRESYEEIKSTLKYIEKLIIKELQYD